MKTPDAAAAVVASVGESVRAEVLARQISASVPRGAGKPTKALRYQALEILAAVECLQDILESLEWIEAHPDTDSRFKREAEAQAHIDATLLEELEAAERTDFAALDRLIAELGLKKGASERGRMTQRQGVTTSGEWRWRRSVLVPEVKMLVSMIGLLLSLTVSPASAGAVGGHHGGASVHIPVGSPSYQPAHRPGYTYVAGYYDVHGHWTPGYWLVARVGYHWVDGHYSNGHYSQGYWSSSRNVGHTPTHSVTTGRHSQAGSSGSSHEGRPSGRNTGSGGQGGRGGASDGGGSSAGDQGGGARGGANDGGGNNQGSGGGSRRGGRDRRGR